MEQNNRLGTFRSSYNLLRRRVETAVETQIGDEHRLGNLMNVVMEFMAAAEMVSFFACLAHVSCLMGIYSASKHIFSRRIRYSAD